MKRCRMSNEEAIVKILCEINNRLNEIAITLQTLGMINVTEDADFRLKLMSKLSVLSLEQRQKYASLEVTQSR